jgi:hypothetical protein
MAWNYLNWLMVRSAGCGEESIWRWAKPAELCRHLIRDEHPRSAWVERDRTSQRIKNLHAVKPSRLNAYSF